MSDRSSEVMSREDRDGAVVVTMQTTTVLHIETIAKAAAVGDRVRLSIGDVLLPRRGEWNDWRGGWIDLEPQEAERLAERLLAVANDARAFSPAESQEGSGDAQRT